ncbi:nucleotidyltransferase substrate binding protein [Massilia sp. R2A-15]|uniref:nucleotidyltransferase substrate binding protein n=1 Tax=Massilia sp. R2A-15 TaxID=3064278 RepID=UPI002735B069|nr:nucleotidyltransferase substrate binding protein [Massilia sp. R2A-15]WLI89795.1 nucleotidyltransferase substrate binding protein [Massilia sp. R2A-15]
MNQESRWKQRFDNYRRALATLDKAAALAQQRPLSELEQQGLIQGFEFTHELAWNMLKDFLEEQGVSGLIGSRDAIRTAFKNDLIADGETWMDMIKDHNLSSHTYQLDLANRIAADILTRFYPAFQALAETMTKIANGEDK